MKLCEISFLSKKSCRKVFFKYWYFYPIRGSELVKIFEIWGWKIILRFFGFHPIWGSELVKMFGKSGWKMFLRFFGFYPIWGSELVKIFEKWGWNFFLRFFGFSQCEIVWNKFLSKKSCREKFFQILKFLPYKGIRTCKNFWKMGLINVFAFFRL